MLVHRISWLVLLSVLEGICSFRFSSRLSLRGKIRLVAPLPATAVANPESIPLSQLNASYVPFEGSNDIIIEFDRGTIERKYFLPKNLHNATREEAWQFWREKKKAEQMLNQAIENKEEDLSIPFKTYQSFQSVEKAHLLQLNYDFYSSWGNQLDLEDKQRSQRTFWRPSPNVLAVQGLTGEVMVGFENVTQYGWGGDGGAPVLKDVNVHFYGDVAVVTSTLDFIFRYSSSPSPLSTPPSCMGTNIFLYCPAQDKYLLTTHFTSPLYEEEEAKGRKASKGSKGGDEYKAADTMMYREPRERAEERRVEGRDRKDDWAFQLSRSMGMGMPSQRFLQSMRQRGAEEYEDDEDEEEEDSYSDSSDAEDEESDDESSDGDMEIERLVSRKGLDIDPSVRDMLIQAISSSLAKGSAGAEEGAGVPGKRGMFIFRGDPSTGSFKLVGKKMFNEKTGRLEGLGKPMSAAKLLGRGVGGRDSGDSSAVSNPTGGLDRTQREKIASLCISSLNYLCKLEKITREEKTCLVSSVLGGVAEASYPTPTFTKVEVAYLMLLAGVGPGEMGSASIAGVGVEASNSNSSKLWPGEAGDFSAVESEDLEDFVQVCKTISKELLAQ
eukprot:gene34330-41553_t